MQEKKPRRTWQPTFGAITDDRCPNGLLPADAIAQGAYGMIYAVTLVFEGLGRTKVYVGSKVFRAGWTTYRTSSAEVKEIIEGVQMGLGGPRIEYEILSYVQQSWQMHSEEDRYIVWAKSRFGDNCYNRATSTGKKLTNGRNRWAKPRRERFGGQSVYEVG